MFNDHGEQTMMYFIVKCALFGLNSDRRTQIFLMSTKCIQESRQAKEHISKYHFTPGSWSQLFLTLPLGSVRRSQAIYEDIYTTHNLTVPIVYHFVICIFTSITSKLFITSKLNKLNKTTKLRLNLLVSQLNYLT